jgi:hypothetical protein
MRDQSALGSRNAEMTTNPTAVLRFCFAHGFCMLLYDALAAAELLCGMTETE